MSSFSRFASTLFLVIVLISSLLCQANAQNTVVSNVYSGTTCGSLIYVQGTTLTTACAVASAPCTVASANSLTLSCTSGTLAKGNFYKLYGNGTASVIVETFSENTCATFSSVLAYPLNVCISSGGTSGLKYTATSSKLTTAAWTSSGTCAGNADVTVDYPLTAGVSTCQTNKLYTLAGTLSATTATCALSSTASGCKSSSATSVAVGSIPMIVSAMSAIVVALASFNL